MTRRKKNSSLHFNIVAIALLALGVATFVIAPKAFDSHRTKARLDIPSYLKNPEGFAGNSYLVEAEVENRIAGTHVGTAFAVKAGDQPMAIIVPNQILPAYNIEKGLRVFLDVRIAEDGSAIATTITKK